MELAGRRFPTVTVICPPYEDEDVSDAQRSLGYEQDNAYYIPAENGLLFEVEWIEWPTGTVRWSLHLLARSCILHRHGDDENIYLPHDVYLVHGSELRTGINTGGIKSWTDCELDWVVETIDRLSRKPFTQPDGPHVTLMARSEVVL